MNKNLLLIIAFLATIALSFTSCKTSEEAVISRLEKLSDRIDRNGSSFDSEDWSKAFKDLEKIHQDMKGCDFTSEQLKQVVRADGKLTATIAKKGAKVLSKEGAGLLKELSSIAKEFQEGIMDIFNEEDLKELEDEFEDVLKDIENDWEKEDKEETE